MICLFQPPLFVSLCLVLGLFLYGGCKPSGAEKPSSPPDAHAGHQHDESGGDADFHSHSVGPKGGLLAVLGRHQFHAELLADEATGTIAALVYNDHFKPIVVDAKDLTLNIMSGGQPKQFTFLVDNDGSDGSVATYKITDTDLAKLLKNGWDGHAQVSITVKGNPASGGLAAPAKH